MAPGFLYRISAAVGTPFPADIFAGLASVAINRASGLLTILIRWAGADPRTPAKMLKRRLNWEEKAADNEMAAEEEYQEESELSSSSSGSECDSEADEMEVDANETARSAASSTRKVKCMVLAGRGVNARYCLTNFSAYTYIIFVGSAT